MNKKLKNNGITLISLVITIIVMLILVGVSINLAVNGGLFEYAGNAVGDTENAMKNEQDLVNTIIDDYIKKYTGEKEHEWKREGDTFTCKKHPEEIYTIGDRVDYTATPGTTEIEYSKLGWTDDQELYGKKSTITTQTQDVVWRVLGVDEETGSLLITTDGGVGFFLEYDDGEGNTEKGLINFPIYIDGNFGSVEGYNNGPSEMNRICRALYSNSEYGYAQSMTIEDVNKVLQHNQPGGIVTTYASEGCITYKNGFGKIKDTTIYSTMKKAGWDKTPDGRDIGEYNIDGYTYKLGDDDYLEDLYGTKFEQMTSLPRMYMVFYCLGDSGFGESSYWLASRGMDADYVDWASMFGLGQVTNGQASSYSRGVFSSFGILSLDEDAEDSIDFQALRPVVYCNKSKLPKKISSLYDEIGD